MSSSRRPALWLLLLAFAIHDSEELLTVPAWVGVHQQQLRIMLSRLGVSAFGDSLPTTLAEAALAISFFIALFCVVTAGVWFRPDSKVWRSLYGGLLGAFLLHTLTHIAQTLIFRAYTPGLITAILVDAPVSVLLGASLLRRCAIDLKPSVFMAAIGIVLFPPSALAAFRLSHWLLAL